MSNDRQTSLKTINHFIDEMLEEEDYSKLEVGLHPNIKSICKKNKILVKCTLNLKKAQGQAIWVRDMANALAIDGQLCVIYV